MATKVADICVASSGARIVVNLNHLTFSAMEKLAEGYAAIKQKHSLFHKYPMQEDEAVDVWAERILPLMEEENKKGEKESTEAYITRVYALKLDKQVLLKDTVGLIAETFGQGGNVDDLGFNNASYPSVKAFVMDVFRALDLSTRDFE